MEVGTEGLATYRRNNVIGSVLSGGQESRPQDFGRQRPQPPHRNQGDPRALLASLRWPGRPKLAGGNPAWTDMIEHPARGVRDLRRHVEDAERAHPFEVWVNGAEQPRGLGAVAKTLSMDMRANDPVWLRLKLETLAKTASDDAFDMPFPRTRAEEDAERGVRPWRSWCAGKCEQFERAARRKVRAGESTRCSA